MNSDKLHKTYKIYEILKKTIDIEFIKKNLNSKNVGNSNYLFNFEKKFISYRLLNIPARQTLTHIDKKSIKNIMEIGGGLEVLQSCYLTTLSILKYF